MAWACISETFGILLLQAGSLYLVRKLKNLLKKKIQEKTAREEGKINSI